MLENLSLFNSVSNNSYFQETTIILLFSKIDVFLPRLISRPLQKPFNPVENGADVDQNVEYLIAQFAQPGRSPDLLRSHVIGGTNGSNISETYQFITKNVSDILQQRNLSELCQKFK